MRPRLLLSVFDTDAQRGFTVAGRRRGRTAGALAVGCPLRRKRVEGSKSDVQGRDRVDWLERTSNAGSDAGPSADEPGGRCCGFERDTQPGQREVGNAQGPFAAQKHLAKTEGQGDLPAYTSAPCAPQIIDRPPAAPSQSDRARRLGLCARFGTGLSAHDTGCIFAFQRRRSGRLQCARSGRS
jgi:hypothetical protein